MLVFMSKNMNRFLRAIPIFAHVMPEWFHGQLFEKIGLHIDIIDWQSHWLVFFHNYCDSYSAE